MSRNFLVPSLLFILIFWLGFCLWKTDKKNLVSGSQYILTSICFPCQTLSGTTLAAAAESKCITPSSVALHALMTFLTASLNVYTTQYAFTKRGMSRYFRMGHFKRMLSGLPSMPLWSSHWTACRNGAGGCWKDRGGPFWDPHSNALNVTIVRRRERITVFNQLIQHESQFTYNVVMCMTPAGVPSAFRRDVYHHNVVVSHPIAWRQRQPNVDDSNIKV